MEKDSEFAEMYPKIQEMVYKESFDKAADLGLNIDLLSNIVVSKVLMALQEYIPEFCELFTVQLSQHLVEAIREDIKTRKTKKKESTE